jgi:hypothetical protein
MMALISDIVPTTMYDPEDEQDSNERFYVDIAIYSKFGQQCQHRIFNLNLVHLRDRSCWNNVHTGARGVLRSRSAD